MYGYIYICVFIYIYTLVLIFEHVMELMPEPNVACVGPSAGPGGKGGWPEWQWVAAALGPGEGPWEPQWATASALGSGAVRRTCRRGPTEPDMATAGAGPSTRGLGGARTAKGPL